MLFTYYIHTSNAHIKAGLTRIDKSTHPRTLYPVCHLAHTHRRRELSNKT